jgi:hypothetical protein
MTRRGVLWGAHSSRVLVAASRRDELLMASVPSGTRGFHSPVLEVRFGGTPKPTLGTSVLPGKRRVRVKENRP